MRGGWAADCFVTFRIARDLLTLRGGNQINDCSPHRKDVFPGLAVFQIASLLNSHRWRSQAVAPWFLQAEPDFKVNSLLFHLTSDRSFSARLAADSINT